MSALTRFPNLEEREAIKEAAESWLGTMNYSLREHISGKLGKMLDEFGVNKIVLGEMVVLRESKQVKVSSLKKNNSRFCFCGERICPIGSVNDSKVRMLSIWKKFRCHTVTYFCEVCGKIFSKDEDTWEC